MRVYRLHRRQRHASDFLGSLLLANRWNPEGVPLLYCSTSLALACLEILVHLSPEQVPPSYVYSSAEIGAAPQMDFQGDLADPLNTREHGRRWVVSKASLATLVPSVIIPVEFNCLLNPTHRGFSSVSWDPPQHFEFDRRLLKQSNAPL